MKRLLPLLSVLLVLASTARAQEEITLETKFIETSIAVTPPLDAATLGRMKDLSLLSAPRVSMKSGQKATVEITHEQPLPAGEVATQETVKPGITLEAETRFQGEQVAYRLRLTKCEVVNADLQPAGVVETASHDLYATGTSKVGEPLWLRFPSPRTGRQTLVQVTFVGGGIDR